MKINSKIDKGHWVQWEDGAEIKVRPFPASQLTEVENQESQVAQALAMFKHCVMDWKGIEDENGRAYTCTEAHKKYIFDHVPELRDFVINEVSRIMVDEEDELKN